MLPTNNTDFDGSVGNDVTNRTGSGLVSDLVWSTTSLVTANGFICCVGLIGNCLVVGVICRHVRMKTVTNLFIVNLSVTDILFLTGLPLVMTTAILKYWAFGWTVCKIYLVLTCINMFTGAYTITLMSADRFIAVRFPVQSIKYRTLRYATVEAALTWVLSFAVMFPIVLYADIVPQEVGSTYFRCVVQWPIGMAVDGARAYVVYTFVVGFLLPVGFISIFYTLLVLRLRANRKRIRSAGKHRKLTKHNVTGLVSIVIVVFIACWLPYWIFQLRLVITQPVSLSAWEVYLFQCFTILSYANSCINPILYAFTNDSFKKAFLGACRCISDPLWSPGNHTSVISRPNPDHTLKALDLTTSRQEIHQQHQCKGKSRRVKVEMEFSVRRGTFRTTTLIPEDQVDEEEDEEEEN